MPLKTKSNRIYFRKFEEKHFQDLISWVDSPRLLMQFGGSKFLYPLNAEQLLAHLSLPQRLHFQVFLRENNQPVGHAELQRLNTETGLICRVMVGPKELRGKGLGLEIIQEICRIGFSIKQFKQLQLNVYAWNRAAISCYEKAGFKLLTEPQHTVTFETEKWEIKRMELSALAWKRHLEIQQSIS